MINKIKKRLYSDYGISIDVNSKRGTDGYSYTISPAESDGHCFKIDVLIQEIRLTVVCEPERYGAEFLNLISKADNVKKTKFCELWEILDSEYSAKTVLRVNDIPIDREDFPDFSSSWQKFSFTLKKSPYFSDEPDKENIITETISVICGMILSLFDYEIEGYTEGYKEGSASYIQSEKYERNKLNRKICLAHKGYKCSVCGFDFEHIYGEIGKNYIHVHHTTPVSQMGDNYIVDPVKELFPVCPNCHAMLHKSDPPFSIDELKQKIKNI